MPLADGWKSEYTDKTSYFFSDRHVRRRPLRFLETPDTSQWELFAPVLGTNRWVRVRGPLGPNSRHTNSLVITVFTPDQLLNQQEITTRDSLGTNHVRFLGGNRIVTCKSENDEFVYNVLEDNLDKQNGK
jgi:hypothetical protein